MTTGGMIIMVLSVGFVAGLFGFCLWKVCTTPPREKLHAFEGEVPDPHRDE